MSGDLFKWTALPAEERPLRENPELLRRPIVGRFDRHLVNGFRADHPQRRTKCAALAALVQLAHRWPEEWLDVDAAISPVTTSRNLHQLFDAVEVGAEALEPPITAVPHGAYSN
jgi:hypothetical protein